MAQISNWFGDVVSHPQVIAEAKSVDDIMAILKDPVKYPSPVRSVGSNHSTSRCGVAEGGTVIRMAGMNKILDIGPDTVTTQAGALSNDIAHELQKRTLQFHVDTEIGSLSAGSAACSGTKDASMPGERLPISVLTWNWSFRFCSSTSTRRLAAFRRAVQPAER